MPVAATIAIDSMLWTATKFSDVLKIDRRAVAQALETAPFQMHQARKIWHVRDGMPAIFKQVYGINNLMGEVNPDQLAPRDRLDYVRSQRELLKFREETKNLLPAEDVARVLGEAFKVLAQGLSALPDSLERECGLSAPTVTALHRSIDSVRETLYTSVMALLEATP